MFVHAHLVGAVRAQCSTVTPSGINRNNSFTKLKTGLSLPDLGKSLIPADQISSNNLM